MCERTSQTEGKRVIVCNAPRADYARKCNRHVQPLAQMVVVLLADGDVDMKT